MPALSDDKRQKIITTHNGQEHVSRLFVFDHIPNKRLMRAVRNYAYNITALSDVIFLYDGSPFGTGGMGFVLTPETLYYKDLVGHGECLVADITEITFDPRAKPEASLFVRTRVGGRFQIGVWNLEGNRGDVVLRILDSVVGILQNRGAEAKTEQGEATAPARRRVVCESCGARYANDTEICEYCGDMLI